NFMKCHASSQKAAIRSASGSIVLLNEDETGTTVASSLAAGRTSGANRSHRVGVRGRWARDHDLDVLALAAATATVRAIRPAPAAAGAGVDLPCGASTGREGTSFAAASERPCAAAAAAVLRTARAIRTLNALRG